MRAVINTAELFIARWGLTVDAGRRTTGYSSVSPRDKMLLVLLNLETTEIWFL